MRNNLLVTILILIPVFLLVAEDTHWEKLSLSYIRKIGDRTDARSKLSELGYADDRSYENYRYRQIILSFLAISFETVSAIFFSIKLTSLFALAAFSITAILYVTVNGFSPEGKSQRESIEYDFPT